MAKGKTNKKEFEGVVVGNKMQNTVRVQVNTPVRHPVYKKVVNKRKTFFAHTDQELNEGDEVRIRESRPYSKNVKWVVVKDNGK
jgi:small subunit ribosomal protein S17